MKCKPLPASTSGSPSYRRSTAAALMAAFALALVGTLVCYRAGQGSGQTDEQASDEVIDVQREMTLGVEDLRAGRAERALEHLDKVVQSAPQSEPYLWQRGIAQYFAGKYQAGREQFESHRSVNPNDVENATWHFLCVAALKDVKAAREAMLPAPGDRRVPMKELYALYKGDGDRQAVETAVNQFPQDSAAYRDARFYADLYLGLLAHAEGKTEEAARHLQAAGAVPDQNVMADVARVCRDRLVAKKTTKPQVTRETSDQ